jgi:hypothetical protein
MPSISASSSGPRGDSYGLAGTHEGAITKTFSGTFSAASRSQCTPCAPTTFASSCGSQTIVVVPRASTISAKRSSVSSDDSMCTCESTKPGTSMLPFASTVSRPS